MKLFLSFTFADQDREMINQIERLLASHSVRIINGRRLGGRLLLDEIQRRIKNSDGLIALMSRFGQVNPNQWTTHPWVQEEFGVATQANMRNIALLEDGVTPPGSVAQFEHIPFDRNNRTEALLALSETLGLWKDEVGRMVKVQILPEDLARSIGQGNGNFRCQYRVFSENKFSDWSDVTPVLEPGGTFVFLNRVHDDQSIQILVTSGQNKWASPVRSQWMEFRLEARQP